MFGNFFSSVGEFFLEITQTVVVVLSIFLILYLFIMQPHQVNGLSMYPNYENGDYLLTDKVSYKTGMPQRGDVVVFHAPEAAQCPTGTGCDFIKRVLGLPGESVEVKDNGIWINGHKITEPYIPEENYTRPGAFTQNRVITLGRNEYFVSGDNRPHSSDSRAWGPITPKEIVGKAFFRYWPPKSFGMFPVYTYAF
ncbi:MAG: signal peptidase I [Candidatus Pacebacteria bacterium]|nr:signal peptidase I [Candidatus Paceibacterota bacterium]